MSQQVYSTGNNKYFRTPGLISFTLTEDAVILNDSSADLDFGDSSYVPTAFEGIVTPGTNFMFNERGMYSISAVLAMTPKDDADKLFYEIKLLYHSVTPLSGVPDLYHDAGIEYQMTDAELVRPYQYVKTMNYTGFFNPGDYVNFHVTNYAKDVDYNLTVHKETSQLYITKIA